MPSEGRTWEDAGEWKLCIQVDLDIKQLVTLSKRSKKFNIITKYSFIVYIEEAYQRLVMNKERGAEQRVEREKQLKHIISTEENILDIPYTKKKKTEKHAYRYSWSITTNFLIAQNGQMLTAKTWTKKSEIQESNKQPIWWFIKAHFASTWTAATLKSLFTL